MNIIKNYIDETQYYREEIPKKTIVIHHTAGGSNPINVIHGWNFNPERVATSYIIAGKEDKTKSYKEGDIFETFEPKYWAHHLGCKITNNAQINKQSIGIEICNWGQLIKKSDKFYNYINMVIPNEEVEKFTIPYRGFLYYHKYTDVQLNSLRDLLKKLIIDFKIDKTFRAEMFDISQSALNGASGIYTHTSFRADKNDCSPQKNLIEILTAL